MTIGDLVLSFTSSLMMILTGIEFLATCRKFDFVIYITAILLAGVDIVP